MSEVTHDQDHRLVDHQAVPAGLHRRTRARTRDDPPRHHRQPGPDIYVEYKLYNTLVAGLQRSAPAGDRPTETLTLNFTKMDVKYTPFGQDNHPELADPSPPTTSATAKST